MYREKVATKEIATNRAFLIAFLTLNGNLLGMNRHFCRIIAAKLCHVGEFELVGPPHGCHNEEQLAPIRDSFLSLFRAIAFGVFDANC